MSNLNTIPIVDAEYFDNDWMTGAQKAMAAVRLNTRNVMQFGDDEARSIWRRDLVAAFGEIDAEAIIEGSRDYA